MAVFGFKAHASTKKESRASGFFFLYFTLHFSLNPPRDFSGEEIREER